MRLQNAKTQKEKNLVIIAKVLKAIARFLCILALLFLLYYSASRAETVISYGYNYSPLNIRKEMSIKSEWIAQYPRESTIEILEDLGDWYRVENGYVKKEFVYPSIEINMKGKALDDIAIFADYIENNENNELEMREILGVLKKDTEQIFVSKVNGYLELLSGGFVKEKFITFNLVTDADILVETLSVEDMKPNNMPNLQIRYIGTLKQRTSGSCVNKKKTLHFVDEIPIYDILNQEAYFPSGREIYKIPLTEFSEIKKVGASEEILASYRTIYYSSSKERKHNIELVSSFLDGTIINAGETFSYNQTTGPRNAKKGYEQAPVISRGEYVLDYGGGVCQVSSTIYAAILTQPNFKVVERKPHGLEVTYLPLKMDATVSYGSIDLKFVNQYEFPVKLNVKSEDGVCLVTITRVQ